MVRLLMSNTEWKFLEPFLKAICGQGGRKPAKSTPLPSDFGTEVCQHNLGYNRFLLTLLQKFWLELD